MQNGGHTVDAVDDFGDIEMQLCWCSARHDSSEKSMLQMSSSENLNWCCSDRGHHYNGRLEAVDFARSKRHRRSSLQCAP